MLPSNDVTIIRARALAHVGMCAASFDEPELADALLGRGHGNLLSVQDYTGRLLLLREPRWLYKVSFCDLRTVSN